jgi:hypothetical protein
MFSKRIFLTLITAAVMATMVNAQSNDRNAGWAAKMAGKGQATGTRSIGAAATTSEAAATNARSESSEDSDDDSDRGTLEGTWRATETFGDGSVFRILYTFGAGKNSKNGVVAHTDELFLVAVPSCLTAQGVWKRTGERKFIITDEGFCFDSEHGFAPVGKIKFEAATRLNNQGTEFNGTLHIEGFDVFDNQVFTDDAILHGVRMRAEAPQ